MFLIGFVAQIQLKAMLAYLCAIMIKLDRIPSEKFDDAVFLILLKGVVPIFVRLINSKCLLRVCKSKKIAIICILEYLAWLILFKSFYDDELYQKREKIYTISVACLIQIVSFSLAESVILGFMKDLP